MQEEAIFNYIILLLGALCYTACEMTFKTLTWQKYSNSFASRKMANYLVEDLIRRYLCAGYGDMELMWMTGQYNNIHTKVVFIKLGKI